MKATWNTIKFIMWPYLHCFNSWIYSIKADYYHNYSLNLNNGIHYRLMAEQKSRQYRDLATVVKQTCHAHICMRRMFMSTCKDLLVLGVCCWILNTVCIKVCRMRPTPMQTKRINKINRQRLRILSMAKVEYHDIYMLNNLC